MTNLNLFDALEICLQALDQGADVESCLVRFPALADELRPILTAATQARSSAVMDVPADAMRRGRARVLQAAAEMREQSSAAPALPFWRRQQKGLFGARFFRMATTTVAMLVFLLTGGTGLVNASSNALPGDHLYPVKRSWEGVRLFFVLDSSTKVQLEHEFDHERVQEIEELYTKKQIAQVNFQGVVVVQNNNQLMVDGLEISVDGNTNLGENIRAGSRVQIIGETDDGVIKAQQISLIATPGITPGIEPSATIAAPTEADASRTPDSTEVQNDNGDDNQKSEGIPGISNPTRQPDDGSETHPTGTRRPGEKKPGNGGSGSGSDNGNGNNDNGNDNNGNDSGGGSTDNGGGN
jgi:hypothetical protein